MRRHAKATSAVSNQRRGIRLPALLLAATFALALAIAPAAQAAKGVYNFFGSTGTGNGQFSATTGVGGVAVNETGNGSVAAGTVYAVDRGNNRVEYFSAAGTYEGQFGSTGAAAGQLSTPEGVAVDQSTGNVYVTDQTNHRVDVFSATGSFEGAFGWGVKSADTAPYSFDFCTTASGCKAGQTGAGAGEFAASIGYPAVDPSAPHDVYVADTTNHRIDDFSIALTGSTVTGVSFHRGFGWGVLDGTAELQTCTTACLAGKTGTGAGEFGLTGPSRVVVDSSGNIYAVDSALTGANFRVEKFNSAATSEGEFAPTVLSGAATTSAPTDIAVDPISGDVYVVKAFEAGKGAPPAAVAERRVLELSSAGALEETDMAGAALNSVNGLALNSTSGRLYVSSTATEQRVYTIDNVPAPSAIVIAATAVTAHSATINGTVTPAATPLETSYQFEYSANGTEWTKVPASPLALGNGSGAGSPASCPTGNPPTCEVSQSITGLNPHQTYQIRLIATTAFAGSSTTATGAFITEAVPPEAATGGAWWSGPPSTEPSLLLSGLVNPENDATTYYFQYVSEKAFEESGYAESTTVPASSAEAGSGLGNVVVEQRVFGLSPSTAYHYRLIAVNSAEASTGAGQTVAAPTATDRFYEMVTPLEKGAHSAFFNTGTAVSTEGGAIANYQSLGQFGDAGNFRSPGLGNNNAFLSLRGASGWATFTAWPPAAILRNPLGTAADFSPNLSREVYCGAPDGIPGESPLLVCVLHEADGSWVSSPIYPSISGNSVVNSSQVGASADLSHVVIQPPSGAVHLLSADNNVSEEGYLGSLYEVAGLGTDSPVLRLVNVDNSDSVIGPGNKVGLGAGVVSTGGSQAYHHYQAISENGQTIYFTATPTAQNGFGTSAGVQTIFARLTGTTTVDVSNPSPSQCTTCNPTAQPAEYQGASADGSKVFFTTTQQLVNNDTDNTTDLYEYDFDKPAGRNIVRLSGVNPGDLGSGANVQGVVNVSSDGSRVYFVATRALTNSPNGLGQTATQGADNLYVSDTETDESKFVAKLCSGTDESGSATDPQCPSSTSDSSLWSGSEIGPSHAQSTPDGRYLVFQTAAQLAPDDTDHAEDIYRYDSKTGELLRISHGAGPGGAADFGNDGNTEGMNATIAPADQSAYADSNERARAISNDGSTIIFSTSEQLQPDDVNSANDVYEWHGNDSGGTVAMVSDGLDLVGADNNNDTAVNSSASAQLSASGEDVFFLTHTRLVGADTDTLNDVYDARIGGGFSSQSWPAAAVCASGEACQGSVSQAEPAAATPGSSTFSGPGNEPAPPPAKPKKPKRHHKKKHRKHSHQRSHKRQAKRAGHNGGGAK